MKTYYSIIKVVSNSLIDDSISVGMVLSDNNKFFINFSKSKLRVAKTLIGESSKLLDFFISHIEKQITRKNADLDLFANPTIINENYFLYLSKYNNNLIQYQEPKFIKEENSVDVFNKLFSLFIDKNYLAEPELKKKKPFDKTLEVIDRKLISRVKNKVHTNIKFTDKIVPALYFNYEMDCIGLNGVFTGAKSIDFNHSEQTLQKELSNYFALTDILENAHNKSTVENNFYLIANEPESINSKEHKIWEHVNKLQKFKLIHPEESDIVARKIEQTHASTFIEV